MVLEHFEPTERKTPKMITDKQMKRGDCKFFFSGNGLQMDG